MPSIAAKFIEIIIIGIGGFGAVLFLFFTTVPVKIPENPWEYFPFLIAPALTLDYILGSILDRAADLVVSPVEKKLKRKYCTSEENYIEVRTWVYIWSESARASFEYGKSRIRICRGWILNGFILIFCSRFFINARVPEDMRSDAAVFACCLFIFLTIASVLAWYSLSRDHFSRMSCYYDKLKDYRSKKETTFKILKEET